MRWDHAGIYSDDLGRDEGLRMDLWDGLELRPVDIVACMGAGGKTSMIMTLARCARERHIPVVITATTKMFLQQVTRYHPVIVEEYEAGQVEVDEKLKRSGQAAWFREVQFPKVIGIHPEWVDELALKQSCCILVEADGAAQCLIKAPASHEPVIPRSTTMTIGVLSLQAIGKPLSPATSHRLPLVLELLNKKAGSLIEWRDLAKLALYRHGIFQYAQGRKVLLLTGADANGLSYSHKVAEYLTQAGTDISLCIATEGVGELMRPSMVKSL